MRVVTIPSQDEEGIREGCLLIADEQVMFLRCLMPVVGGAGVVGGGLNSCQQNSSKFPQQVEQPALNVVSSVYTPEQRGSARHH